MSAEAALRAARRVRVSAGARAARNGSSPPAVRVAVGTGPTMLDALLYALEEAGLAAVIAAAREARRGEPVRAVVRPVLAPGAQHEEQPLRYAEPGLVEALAEWVAPRAGAEVAIAAAGPGATAAAPAVGYRRTVYDLHAERVPFHYGGLIGDHDASRAWLEADVRLLVGKARTDRQLLYAGATLGALATVPDSDALAAAFPGAHDIAACANDVCERLPPSFAVIDAWFSADGTAPPWAAGEARATRSVIASADTMAADWVMAEIMDVRAPELGAVMRETLQRRGAVALDRAGDLTEWAPFSGVGAVRAALADIAATTPLRALWATKEVPWTAR